MTNEEVINGCNEVFNGFWVRYRTDPPGEDSPEWEQMHTWVSVLKKKYPLLEETINRLMTEIIERAKGRGNVPGGFHRPPR